MPKDKIRAIAGENEDDLGTVPADLNKTTGMNCKDGQWECLGSEGNGWIRVKNEEVEDEDADHCFTVDEGDHPWGSCFANEPSRPDDKTMNASVKWSYPATVTRLKRFVTP